MIDLTDGACSGDGELAHEKTPGPAWGAGVDDDNLDGTVREFGGDGRPRPHQRGA